MTGYRLAGLAAPVTDSTSLAVSTAGLGKQYRGRAGAPGTWALRDCTLQVPAGRICGLVGANGAGKTTLLKLLVGLCRPSAGSAEVLGRQPGDVGDFLSQVGYLAQDIPLYRRLTVADHLTMGDRLNPGWDDAVARDRLRSLGIPLEQRVGTLSGGQRAQVALALALGKRPRLLLLDEPVAAMDPLARREFLATLSMAVAEADGELTVILSSHLVSDLERICDYLIVLAESRNLLTGDLADVLASHRLLTAARRDTAAIERQHTVLRVEHTQRQTSLLARLNGPLHDPGWQSEELSLEDIVLAYLGLAHQPVAERDGGLR